MNRSIKLTSPDGDTALALPANTLTVEPIQFEASDWVPNNRQLPVLLYHDTCPDDRDMAAFFEDRFRQNGWTGIWRNGIFDYHHYHSGAHEVLGIAEGRARVMIGGPSGQEINLHAGDCLVLPAGTGHMRIEASRDFLVVGAYPPGQEADIRTNAATHSQLQTIASLPVPPTDPLEGAEGPLKRFWRPSS